MVSVQASWNQLSPPKPSLLETRGFRTLSTPSLSNWIKIEQALSPTLLSPWLPETGTHSQPPSSPRLITFSCLRPASTDTFNSYQPIKSSLLPLFTMEGPTQAFKGCTFLGVSPSHISFIKKIEKNDRFFLSPLGQSLSKDLHFSFIFVYMWMCLNWCRDQSPVIVFVANQILYELYLQNHLEYTNEVLYLDILSWD